MSGINASYSRSTAPCICAQGLNQHTGVHGEYHKIVDFEEFKAFSSSSKYKFGEARSNAMKSVKDVNNLDSENEEHKKVLECVELQLKNYYEKRCGMKDGDSVNASGKHGKNLQGAPSTPAIVDV
jgi:hypothetical protein